MEHNRLDIANEVAWGSAEPDTLIAWFQERMNISGINQSVAHLCGISLKIDDNGAYFTLPYHTIDAVPTLFTRQRNQSPQKVFESDQSGAEFKGRYTQPKGSKNRVYWAPLHSQRAQYSDVSTPLLICEGELKAIRAKMACAAGQHDVLVCGVPGTQLGGEVYSELDAIVCDVVAGNIRVRRPVFLALDWNGEGRSFEASARLELDLRDMFHRNGADVINLRWPIEEGAGEQKLDEWITRGGDLGVAMEACKELHTPTVSKLQPYWDRLNTEFALCHGFIIPVGSITQKYTPRILDMMASDTKVQLTTKGPVTRAHAIWMMQPEVDRNSVEGYTFSPSPMGQPQDRFVWERNKRMINTAPDWQWEHSPIGYDAPPAADPFLELLDRLFQEHSGWYLDFLAQIAQHPTIRGHHIIMLQDEGGTGKDRLFDTLHLVFGKYAKGVGTGLTSGFNANMEHNLIPYWSDPVISTKGGLDRFLQSVLKNYSGNTRQEINHKGGAKYEVPSYGRLHIAFNMDWLVPIPENERRYGVFGGLEQMSYSWAKSYMDWLQHEGGVNEIRRLLVERDLSDFHIMGPAPRTDKRVEMEEASRTPIEQFLADDGELLQKDIWSMTQLCAIRKIYDGHTVSPTAMGKAVAKHRGAYTHKHLIRAGHQVVRMTAIRNGAQWRERLEKDGVESWVEEFNKHSDKF